MPVPTILALDFDGVLCEGAAEYFEASRRVYRRVWPDALPPGDERLAEFRTLRAVIESGWEMPVLLRAMAEGVPAERILADWAAVRDALLARDGEPREELTRRLKRTLDAVRREWVAADPADWLGRHRPYCPPAELRRLLAAVPATHVVTTKEGEFARRLLEHWGLPVAGVQGKESGSHKCDTLRQLLAAAEEPAPSLWFVEDRLETLRCVASHQDLEGVGLYFATWGYTTEAERTAAQGDGRVRPLALGAFRAGPAAWPR